MPSPRYAGRADVTVCVEIADPRSDPQPAGWNAFRRDQRLHAIWDYELLRVEAWTARNPPVLAVVRDADRVIAGMCVWVCRPWLRLRYARRPGALRWPATPVWAEIAQPWLSGFPGVVSDPRLDRAAWPGVLRRVERELARYLGVALLGVLYRAVGEDLAAALAGRGRVVRQVDEVAVLVNTFRTSDDWLASLSKNRRKSLRQGQRRLANGPPLVVRGGAARDDLDGSELARLVNAHRRAHGKPLLDTRSPVAGAYFDSFVRRPDVHTLTYHDGEGRLLALSTMLDHSRCLVKQHWASLPVEAGGRRYLMFDSYRRAVRYMISADCPELSAGRRPLEVKRSLGFSTRPVYGVVVPRPVIGR